MKKLWPLAWSYLESRKLVSIDCDEGVGGASQQEAHSTLLHLMHKLPLVYQTKFFIDQHINIFEQDRNMSEDIHFSLEGKQQFR